MYEHTRTPATAVLSIVALFLIGCSSDKGTVEEPNLPKTFDGNSADLNNTVIVPTLDTPMPRGKNVIWCSSFQITWNEMKDKIIGEPIRLDGAQDVAQRLNDAKQTTQDLVPGSYYAASGFIRDGIVQTIQKEMGARFPAEPMPTFENLSNEGILNYCFLQANVKFTIPFFENNNEFIFTDTAGNRARVTSFGVRPEDDYAYERLREQVEVLFMEHDPEQKFFQAKFFAIDLCKYSKPCQIILARIEPKETLEDTLADMQERMARFAKDEFSRRFGINDVILVPNIFWRIIHHFKELEGKGFLNSGYELLQIIQAVQMIQFRLDRNGAELKSEAKLYVAPKPKEFIFDRPFLVCVKKRGAEHPFFVMWVDNAELLSKVNVLASQQ